MFDGNLTRRLSVDRDDNLQRQMGTRTIEDFAEDLLHEAGTPGQLDAVAVQLGHCAARCRAVDFPEAAERWDAAATLARTAADEARARLAAFPSRATHPGFYDNRSATPPGHLDSDLFMPLVIRLHLQRDTVAHACYEPDLIDQGVYSVGPTKLGYTWLTRVDGGRAFKLKTSILRGLIALGRAEALPLSAKKMAA